MHPCDKVAFQNMNSPLKKEQKKVKLKNDKIISKGCKKYGNKQG